MLSIIAENNGKFVVSSTKENVTKKYSVQLIGHNKYICNCPYFTHKLFHKMQKGIPYKPCKHIDYVIEKTQK